MVFFFDFLSLFFFFQDCAEYFGEDPKAGNTTFFMFIVRFVATWKTAEEDNIKRIKLQELENRKNAPENLQKKPESAGVPDMKNAMINELKQNNLKRNNRQNLVKPAPSEIQDGTFEGIILDMKKQPYRSDGMHRSFRRERHKLNPSDSMTVTTNETEPL